MTGFLPHRGMIIGTFRHFDILTVATQPLNFCQKHKHLNNNQLPKNKHMKSSQARPLITVLLMFLSGSVMFSCDSDSDDERSKFLGRYEVEEQSLETYSPREDYEVTIIRDTGSQSLVIITNFYNFDVDVYARVSGNEILVEDESHSLFRFNGSGTLSGSVITMEYTVESVSDDTDYFDRLKAEMVRKD